MSLIAKNLLFGDWGQWSNCSEGEIPPVPPLIRALIGAPKTRAIAAPACMMHCTC